MSTLDQSVLSVIAREARLEVGAIEMTSTMKGLGVDSLDVVQVIFALEDEFKIDFPDQNSGFANGTIRDLIDAVEQAIARRAAPNAIS